MTSDLPSLVGSRICHDLISPIGAISNGVELLSLTDGDTSAEMQLISDAVASANARIRFFRIAFGMSSNDQMVGREEVLSILTATALGGRFTYFWQLEQAVNRSDLRLIFLLLQCLESSLPFGGEISVGELGGSIVLSATATRVAADPEIWSQLAGPLDRAKPIDAAKVHFALVPGALKETGRSLRYELKDAEISVTI